VPPLTSQLTSDASTARVFHCKNLVWTLLAWVVILTFGVLASFVFLKFQGVLAGTVALIVAMGLSALGLILTISEYSNIVVNDMGISRSLLGHHWGRMQWDEMREVESFVTPRFGASTPVRAYRIYRSLTKRFIRPGTIVFTQDIEDLDGLLGMLEHFIHKYHLDVKVRLDGKDSSLTGLLASRNRA